MVQEFGLLCSKRVQIQRYASERRVSEKGARKMQISGDA